MSIQCVLKISIIKAKEQNHINRVKCSWTWMSHVNQDTLPQPYPNCSPLSSLFYVTIKIFSKSKFVIYINYIIYFTCDLRQFPFTLNSPPPQKWAKNGESHIGSGYNWVCAAYLALYVYVTSLLLIVRYVALGTDRWKIWLKAVKLFAQRVTNNASQSWDSNVFFWPHSLQSFITLTFSTCSTLILCDFTQEVEYFKILHYQTRLSASLEFVGHFQSVSSIGKICN